MNGLLSTLNDMLKSAEKQGALSAQISKLREQYNEQFEMWHDWLDDLLSEEFNCDCGDAITYFGNAHDVISNAPPSGKWCCSYCNWEVGMDKVREVLNMTSSEFLHSLKQNEEES